MQSQDWGQPPGDALPQLLPAPPLRCSGTLPKVKGLPSLLSEPDET